MRKKKALEKLKYKNITVSGLICTGTTTLAKSLVKKLGWQFWSGGEFFRGYCKKHGLALEASALRPDELSKKIDFGMQKRLRRDKHLIIEAWLAGFMAQGIDGVLKVLLVCDDALRIDRHVNREQMTVTKAKKLIFTREQENIKKWTRLYGTSDFFNPDKYDLVIDTYSHSRQETLKKVLNELGY